MGQYIGFTFSTALHSAWRESIWGKFVEPALVEPCSEGDARALRGIELLARSWVEADPGIALFLAVAALEAWLTSGDVGGKKFEFARRVAFFMCSGPAVWPDYDYSCPALSKIAEKANARSRVVFQLAHDDARVFEQGHWAFEAYATGDWSLSRLAEALELRGLRQRPTAKRTDRPLPAKKVNEVLRNPY